MKHPQFEVDFKQRLTQRREAREPVIAKAVGKKKYWVVPPTKPVEPKPAALQPIVYGRSGKSTWITTLKNRNTNPPVVSAAANGVHPRYSQYSRYAIMDTSFINALYPDTIRHFKIEPETRWLKEKQATLLRLKGYKVDECE